LQTVTQVAGLLAGLATVVYGTGAVVLSLRLQFVHLPWNNVVSQLPREFLLSIGAGQVLLPAVVVGALYGLYRLIRKERKHAPKPYRLREGRRQAGVVMLRYALTWTLMLLPLAAVSVALSDNAISELSVGLGIGMAILVVVAAMAVQEGRTTVVKRNQAPTRWNSARTATVMAGVYAAAALPSMMLAAAAIPLSEAKVCTTDGYPEWGLLVGESSDRVYLGERPPPEDWQSHHRRLAVFPLTKVEEMFVGPKAWGAICQYTGTPIPSPQGRGNGAKP
jgi:hypothetical protein